jgi:hypothetical protein
VFRHNASKKGESHCEFVDQSRQDIGGVIQIWVISPAEKHSGELLLIMESC